MKNNAIDIGFLNTLLHYDPESGVLRWKVKRGTSGIGKIAGGIKKEDGYYYITLNGRRLLAHRVAWCLHYGEWPSTPIDHINMDRSDNRIANIRLATVTQNNRNRTAQSNNTSGFKGVSFHRSTGKFVAKITMDKKTKSLGYFHTAEEAGVAYMNAAKEAHGEFARVY